jgi:PKD repeat protein
MDASGHPHALFVAGFFSGPVDGFAAASSDTDVARAGVSAPDMLIVAPVSSGSASVTVTASGPGGSASQTFTVRVGTAADESLYSLATDEITVRPSLSAPIPDQTLIVGNSAAVNVSAYFSGRVQGWAVTSSAPTSVVVSVDNTGVVRLTGSAIGTSTITVTATNDAGSVAYGFTVSVKTAEQVILTTVGDRPQLLIAVGQTVAVDLSRYFSEAATEFDVTYDRADPNRLVDVTMQGSVASIRALRTGRTTITLVAASATARISRPAALQVTG